MESVPKLSGNRVIAGLAAAAVQFMLAYALFDSLALRTKLSPDADVRVFEVRSVPPPIAKPVIRPPVVHKPARLRLPTIAPPAAPSLPLLPPLVFAPVPVDVAPATGSDHAGSIVAPAGVGSGAGDGAIGDATGGAVATPAQRLPGGIKDSDYPDAAYRARIGGSLTTQFVVGVNGRVTNCSVTESSGNADLDEGTCRLVMRRYRYRPARDARGQPVPVTLSTDHSWIIADDAGPPR
jgi:periplasmic protein TonB